MWWEDEIKKVEKKGNPDMPAEEMDAEDMLFILYTSGSTGKPKGALRRTVDWYVKNEPWWRAIKERSAEFKAYYAKQYGKS